VTAASFVGRTEELRRLEAAALAARDGAGSQIVLLGGDAGIGKTRLVDEVCARWRAEGGLAGVGACVDVGAAGYAPLQGVLRELRGDVGDAAFDELLEQIAPDVRPLVRGSGDGHERRQGTVLGQMVALLDEVGRRWPGTIVVFEDLHWADASTQDLVIYLVSNLATSSILLLLTYRADDVHRRHPLRPLLSELERRTVVDVMHLEGMSRSELTVLLASVGGSVPRDDVVDNVLARSEGNPFYAEELFAGDPSGPSFPATLRDAILGRIASHSDPTPAVIREAAVLGEHIDERLLAAVTGRPINEVADALHEALAHHLLVAGVDGCRFRHALVRETAYDDLLPGERQQLHEAAAGVLESRPELAPEQEHVRWSSVAHHWTAAQDQPKAFSTSVRAAIASEEVGALSAAAIHFQRALELWSRVADPEAACGVTHVELLLRAASVAYHAGAPADAVGLVQTALDLLPPTARPEERAVLLQLLGDHRWAACDEAGSGVARSMAVDVLADRPPSPELAQVLAALGGHQMLTDRFIEAESTLERALAIAAQVDAPLARCRALTALGFALTKLGRWAEGVDACREALAIAERVGTADDIGRAHVMLTATLLSAAQYEEVVAHTSAGLEHARRAGMLASDGLLLSYNCADALYRLGRWDEADAMLAGIGWSSRGPHGMTGAVIAARIALDRGQRDEAERFSTQASTRSAESCACSAQLAALDHRYDDARELSQKAIELAEASQDPSLAATVVAIATAIEADRVEAAALAGPRGQADMAAARTSADDLIERARRHIAMLESRGLGSPADAQAHLATAEAEVHRAHGRLDPAEWEAVAARWDDLQYAYPAAVARYRQADALLRRRGNRERAQSAAMAALRVAIELDAAPLVERLELCAQRGRLDIDASTEPAPAPTDPLADMGVSKREREVLELLAAGRTNRQIAEQLYISDKTASVHVTHLLRKLGVGSRIEAASLAQRLGLGR